jgi:hypothetical protein
MALDFKLPVKTRRGDEVKIYFIYKDYMHGAYYETDRDWWCMATWTLSGCYLGRQYRDTLDLINE